MLQKKFSRQSLAFGLIVIASALLYNAAEWGNTFAIWILLSLIVLAAFITLMNK
ncbi:MAG: hypothetical protein ISR59_10630 [Anaerolineales bacterium]|uniref:Uncharacterized protein n=1 Tax=Candidatus Desulfolinea nitratireducens TaxID=2841698 RepID=A0A8J6NN15_9CHLR|nr:hypothetical protein [Candidatus Desulfolinea nitratireducens]MBL6961554.1 hypothetical protein [Anaerolineales bacterium]